MRRRPGYIKIVLRGQVIEDRPELPFFAYGKQVHFASLLRLLESARLNRRVRAVFLVLKHVDIGWGKIQEIHQELDRLHAAGKRSIACLEEADNKTYYLACGAQTIYIAPAVTLDLVGLRIEILFFKNLLHTLGIEPQLFSLGEYKSAAEIFTREGMSEASRSMLESILSDLQSQLVKKISDRRSVESSTVQEWIDSGPHSARRAVEHGLVDGIRYQDEVDTLLRQDAGLAELPVSALPVKEGLFKRLLTLYRPQIAYLVAEGMLSQGESRRRGGRQAVAGAETLIGFLKHARQRKKVKAVVLRINSPGGSALASDLVWREIQLTNQVKPVIISFGDTAASGGYYIATAGRRILTMPATLTGSIGVIHGKFVLSRLFSQLGVSVDQLEKGKHAGYTSATRPFSPEEADVLQAQMREFYEELFLKKVAENRKKPLEAVRELAEGRVWTGGQAIANGLADQTGGVLDALELAREEAGLPPEKKTRLVHYTRRRTLRDLIPAPVPGVSAHELLALLPHLFRIV